jgi:hypothetical protein
MHSCSETKERITELLLDGADCRSDEALSAELRGCAECRNEFNALNATLRLTTRSLELSAPAEVYWTGYHAKLRQRLVNVYTAKPSVGPSLVQRFFRLSIPVPAPVALALIIAFAILVPVVIRAARQQTPFTPAVVHVPVEVPVIQEKIVTRVVYRDRRPAMRTSKEPISAAPKVDDTFAKSRDVPAILAGFKPTEEVKLTVIKGGSTNEK